MNLETFLPKPSTRVFCLEKREIKVVVVENIKRIFSNSKFSKI